jgi:hypothetical protein
MGKCFKKTPKKNEKKKLYKVSDETEKTRRTKLSLQLFFMENFDRVNGPIYMRGWKGRRFESILKSNRYLR